MIIAAAYVLSPQMSKPIILRQLSLQILGNTPAKTAIISPMNLFSWMKVSPASVQINVPPSRA